MRAIALDSMFEIFASYGDLWIRARAPRAHRCLTRYSSPPPVSCVIRVSFLPWEAVPGVLCVTCELCFGGCHTSLRRRAVNGDIDQHCSMLIQCLRIHVHSVMVGWYVLFQSQQRFGYPWQLILKTHNRQKFWNPVMYQDNSRNYTAIW